MRVKLVPPFPLSERPRHSRSRSGVPPPGEGRPREHHHHPGQQHPRPQGRDPGVMQVGDLWQAGTQAESVNHGDAGCTQHHDQRHTCMYLAMFEGLRYETSIKDELILSQLHLDLTSLF